MKKERITITIDEDVKDGLDRKAVQLRTTVSALINQTMAERILGDPERPIIEDENERPRKT